MELSALLRQFAYDRDLADLVTFAHNASVAADNLRQALDSAGKRRELSLPRRLEVPSSPDWAPGYARVARDAPHIRERDLKSAENSSARFIDPVLDGTANGHWDPVSMKWKTPGSARLER